jgi:hypothetical protein
VSWFPAAQSGLEASWLDGHAAMRLGSHLSRREAVGAGLSIVRSSDARRNHGSRSRLPAPVVASGDIVQLPEVEGALSDDVLTVGAPVTDMAIGYGSIWVSVYGPPV